MTNVLEINGLTKRYGSLTAVNNLQLTVEKGNVYGILGPNGSGKSTTLGMILRVVNPSSGSWTWFDNEDHQTAIKKIGAILESPKFYPYLSAYQNLKIVAQIKNVEDSAIDKSLKLVGLESRKKDLYKTYSLGMKQRLAIASAMLNDPEVLILDEPTNGLDPEGIIQIREIIQRVAAQGVTILLASHLLDEVEKVCSHVVVLNKGEALYAGPVSEMSADKDYYEIAAKDIEKLEELLQSTSFVKSYNKDNKAIITVHLNEELPAEEINEYFFKKDIVLTHLVRKKVSLEHQFLKLLNHPAHV